MRVRVSLYATLKEKRFENREMDLPAGARVRDLMALLDLQPDDVGVLVVNGHPGSFRDRLAEGDRVTLIPPLAGG